MISFKTLGNYGRLGNQLFQIATTIALALRNNDTYIFPHWQYENNFNLHNCFSNNIQNIENYNEPYFHYSPISYKPNLNIQGYFQSEKYFKDYKSVIQQLLSLKSSHNTKYNTTSIHIRRGDYLNLKNEYAQFNISYYQEAMRRINSKQYLIFSDDIDWCKNNFKGDNIFYSENKSVVDDLSNMISCEHNIITNSSFSWWGAYLNKNPSKIVIAPDKWFGPNLPHNTKDLLPKEWEII